MPFDLELPTDPKSPEMRAIRAAMLGLEQRLKMLPIIYERREDPVRIVDLLERDDVLRLVAAFRGDVPAADQ